MSPDLVARALLLVSILGLPSHMLAAPPAEAQAPAKTPDAAPPATSEDAPEAAEATAPPRERDTPDLSALRAELSEILDGLMQARTRATVLAKSLFNTRMDITLLRRADDQRLTHLKLLLDGVPVHDSDGSALGDREAKLFDGFVAPGAHEIGIEIAERAKADAAYQYVRSERFRIQVRRDTRTKIDIILRDRSDMAEELPEGDEGEYDVSTQVRVEPIEVKR
jgi:hypothetical protein